MEPRKFEIKDRTKAQDEPTKSKVNKAVVAGILILGAAAAVYFGGDIVDFNEILNNDAVQFALVFAGARGVMRTIAKARENKKQKRQDDLPQIFDEVEAEEKMRLGGNEDVRTK